MESSMKRRLSSLLALLAVFAAGIAIQSPDGRWRLIGLARNEPFHDGKPASYWVGQLRQGSESEPALDALAHLGPPAAELLLLELSQLHTRASQPDTASGLTTSWLELVGKQPPPMPADLDRLLAEAMRRIGPMAGPTYIQAATDQNQFMRRAAMEALGVVGRKYPPATKALSAGLQDREPTVRQAAIRSLDQIGRKAKAAVPALLQAQASMSAEEAEQVLMALVSMGHSARAAAPVFATLLDNPDPVWRLGAAQCLARIDGIDRAMLPKVCALLDHKTALDARTLAEVFESLQPEHPLVIPTLLRALRDPDLSYRAAIALASHPSTFDTVIPALAKLLNDDDRQVRLAAADVLCRIGPPAQAVIPQLRGMLDDPDRLVRLAASEALWDIKKDAASATAIVIEVLKNVEVNQEPPESDSLPQAANTPIPDHYRSRLIQRCAWQIARIGDRGMAAEPYLLNALRNSDSDICDAVFEALGALGPEARKSIPVLVAAVEKQQNMQAALALWRVSGDSRRALPYLVHTLERAIATHQDASRPPRQDEFTGPERRDRIDARLDAQRQQQAALRCLAEMGRAGKAALPIVRREFQTATKQWRDRLELARVLVKLGDTSDDLIAFLAEMADEEEALYAEIACGLLEEIGPPAAAAIPVLTGAIRDEDKRIIKAATCALRAIAPKSHR